MNEKATGEIFRNGVNNKRNNGKLSRDDADGKTEFDPAEPAHSQQHRVRDRRSVHLSDNDALSNSKFNQS